MTLKINGEEIDQNEIENEIERLRPDYEKYVASNNAEVDEKQLREWCRENIIERTLIRQHANETGKDIPESEIDEIYKEAKKSTKGKSKTAIRKQIELELKTERLIKELSDNVEPPAEKEIKAYYKKNKDIFLAPEQIRVSHIVKHINSPEQKTQAYIDISNVQEQLKKGTSFEQLAAKHSDCPENAGDLGYFTRNEMVQEFDDVVFNMNVGEVSNIFLTPFGYHIAKVYDKKPAGPVPLSEVSDHIAKELHQEKRSKAMEDYVDKLKTRAVIEDA
jgi:parvulin-like peptidyl-prolyl isomerase